MGPKLHQVSCPFDDVSRQSMMTDFTTPVSQLGPTTTIRKRVLSFPTEAERQLAEPLDEVDEDVDDDAPSDSLSQKVMLPVISMNLYG